MCNPRRVRVRATRQLAAAWDHEVRRQVHRTGQATGEARVREPLEASVGGPALAALAAVLAATPGWERVGDTFVHRLDDGYVIYHPLTRELEIVATASAAVEASGEVTRTVRGEVSGAVEAEGVGMYYDDNWGGVTETDARRVAAQRAEEALDAAARERAQQARDAADEREGAAVGAEAEQRAAAALAEAAAARAEELRGDAAARLAAVGIHGRNVFHQALAAAYRDAILAFARSRRADRISCTDTDGVIDIEFELQI
jgi:FtsH ternary system domain X2